MDQDECFISNSFAVLKYESFVEGEGEGVREGEGECESIKFLAIMTRFDPATDLVRWHDRICIKPIKNRKFKRHGDEVSNTKNIGYKRFRPC